MRTALIVSFMLIMQVNAAITTNVVHMDESEVFVTYKGRVFGIEKSNTKAKNLLNKAIENDLQVEIEIETGDQFKSDKNMEKILSVKLLENKFEKEVSSEYLTPMDNYSTSNVESYEKALEIFKTLNTKTRRWSQCFNRAHIWAKHMYDEYSVDSMKILIYYTKRYREEVSKKWWFHIAPMIDVNGQYYVMDREFTRKPVTNDNWEKIFTKKIKTKTGVSNYRCKKIDNIKEFYNKKNTYSEFCNIQYTSMYYWEPNDMSRLDKTGVKKTDWVNWELRISAKEAFRKWKKVYEVRKN